MSPSKRSCSPGTSQSKRCRFTECLCLADRIDRSGSFRECPCHYCFCHSLSCWVARMLSLLIHPLRATTEFLVAWWFAAAISPKCVTHRSSSLGAFPSCYELCKPTSQFGSSPVASPSAASSPAYSAVSLDSADPEDHTGIVLS